jgi:carotenoid 1,2-hydratase
VPSGGYLWWYVDALSDDGRHGLTVIAFVGSVFSPYYRRALSRGAAEAEDHVALNVALYGQGANRWTMTERGRGRLSRSAVELQIGPSGLRWDGQALVIDIDEVAVPLPRRVRGQLRLHPEGLCRFTAALDAAGRHRWGPIAPCARIEVEFAQPDLRWSGHAYLDSNEGDEPVERAFTEWDWSRALLRDGSTAVVYDVRPGPGEPAGSGRVIAQRFTADGRASAFEAPPRQTLPRSKWWLGRTMRSDPTVPARVRQTLEDTPFYVRSVMEAGALGERVTAVHETLDVKRLVSLPVQGMLPFRMPRRS